jgi:hypothetical protein
LSKAVVSIAKWIYGYANLIAIKVVTRRAAETYCSVPFLAAICRLGAIYDRDRNDCNDCNYTSIIC